MKIILSILLLLCSVQVTYAQDCLEWEIDKANHEFKQVPCHANIMPYPAWYDSVGLTEEQIRRSVFGQEVFDHKVSRIGKFRFKGILAYQAPQTAVYPIALQQKKPEPTLIIDQYAFSPFFNILFLLFVLALCIVHWRSIKKFEGYASVILFDAALIFNVILWMSAFTEFPMKTSPAIAGFLLILGAMLYIVFKVKGDLGVIPLSMFNFTITTFFATVFIGTNDGPQSLSVSMRSIIPIFALPAIGIIITAFLWIRSKKKPIPVPDTGITMIN